MRPILLNSWRGSKCSAKMSEWLDKDRLGVSTTIESTGKAYLTLEEAAQIARSSIGTLRRAIASKRLAACKPNGKYGRTLVRRQDLTRYA